MRNVLIYALISLVVQAVPALPAPGGSGPSDPKPIQGVCAKGSFSIGPRELTEARIYVDVDAWPQNAAQVVEVLVVDDGVARVELDGRVVAANFTMQADNTSQLIVYSEAGSLQDGIDLRFFGDSACSGHIGRG